MINKYKLLLISGLVFVLALTTFIFTTKANILSITLDPALNISLFSPYKIKAEISDSPVSAVVEVSGINGNVLSTTTCWDYYTDGRCGSESKTKNMNLNTGLWESTNIYPDDIYPEIYFASSEVTWNNIPENSIFNRNNYQILKFNNPFEMVDGMSFFIEFDVVPQSINNSADLQVYLVAKNKDINFFNNDWRSDPSVALVGTINRNQAFHHTHTSNSSHYLVALSTDSTGKVAGLDVSDDFWVILYNNSPNNARGWSLRYQTICDAEISGYWYQGSQAGWTTSLQSNCPDAHIHVARTLTANNTEVQDGIQAIITATYGDTSIATSSELIYFTPLVNLAPNSTSFTSPVIGNVYSAGPIEISWNPATDPNNDSLLYDIYLLDSEGVATSTLATVISTTTFSWDITGLPNGQYSLKGVITEDIPTDPLSTDFFLGGNFTIDQAATLYSLSNINLSSNNASTTLAKAGDVVTLTFQSSGEIDPVVNIYSGGTQVDSGRVNIASSTNDFTVTYTVQESDDDGLVSFEISASNLNQIYDDTTDASYVMIDTTPPATVIASPGAGAYSTSQSVSLSSIGADSIRYTTDTSDPSCSVGALYASAITVSVPTTIKAIACDDAGNDSGVATFVYNFAYTLTYTAGAGGTISGTSPQTVEHGSSGTAVIAVPDTGYSFTSWSDDVLTASRTDNVTTDITVTANFTINSYTITFDSAGGSAVDPIIQDYGTAITSPTSPTKIGYTFNGWSPELPATMPAENQTYTAQWTFINSGGSAFTSPPAIGDGQLDITIPMNSAGELGQVDDGGINYLSYIGSQANFSTPISTTYNLSNHWLIINNLDLNSQLISFTIKSEPQTFQLALGQSVLVDLDADGIKDIEVKFTDLLVNRSELTIRSVLNNQLINPPSQEISGLDREAIIKEARETFTKKNIALSNRLTGRILLQVEKHGQAWYLDPISQARYYLGRPVDAFAIMRHFGLGVSEENFNKFSQFGVPIRLAGRIILRVETNGEAYYINPLNLKMHYLGRPADAFSIMRELSLGISNINLDQLVVGEID